MPSYQKLALNYDSPNGDIRDQSSIASHTNPSKFVLLPSVWNRLKIRDLYGAVSNFHPSAGNYN